MNDIYVPTTGNKGSRNYNTPGYWNEQFANERQYKNEHSKCADWGKYMNIYEQKFDAPEDPNFNLYYVLGSSFIPATVFHTPHVMNNPRRPEFATWARVFDSIDNALLQESRLQSLLRRAVLEIFLKNIVGIELAYDFPDMFDLEDEETALSFPRTPGTLDHTRRINYPWFDLIPAERLHIAIGTRDKYTMRWWAKERTRPVRLLRKMKGLNKSAIVPNMLPSDLQKIPGQRIPEEEKEEKGYMTYYECHNIETGELFWMDPCGDKFLVPPTEDRMQLDGPSMEPLTMNLGASSIWGTPVASYIYSQWQEGNECRIDARTQRQQALLKIAADSRVWTEEACVNYLTNEAVGFILLDLSKLPPGSNIRDTFVEMQPNVQQEYYEYQDRLRDEGQFLAGMGINQQGQLAPGRRTKAEVQLVDAISRQKAGLVRQDIADLISSHVNRINAIISKHWKAGQVRQVIGIDGALYWVTTNPVDFRDVAQQLVCSTNVDSLAPATRQQRREEMVEMIGVLSKFKGMEMQMFPLVMQLLSSFEWSTMHNALPVANSQGSPLDMQQFNAQQAQLAQDPRTMQTLQNNLSAAQPQLLNSLPSGAA